jgi:hypothetical protein
MRLLAGAAGPTARGRSTEADQVVGRISVEWNARFIVFTGLSFAAAYPDFCGAGCPPAGPVASPSVLCSGPWPVFGWSCCVPATRI